jgi:hypothetical protein
MHCPEIELGPPLVVNQTMYAFLHNITPTSYSQNIKMQIIKKVKVSL